MYLLVIFLIIGLVWYRRRVSGYDLKILNKVKVEPLPSQPDPKSPQKTPKRDFTKLKENPEIKKLQQQTAQYKAVAARQDKKTKTIIQDSAKKIAVERQKATQQVSQIQRQGTNDSKNVQNASGREVRAINLRGNIEAAQIKNKGNAEAQKIRNAADAEAGVIRTQAVRESADIVRNAKKEATNIANKGAADSRRIRAKGTQEAINITKQGNATAVSISQTGVATPKKYRYVRIIRYKSGGDHWMNLAEVEVYSGATNVARGKRVTASSLYSGSYPHRNLTDGNRSNFTHTHNGNVEWFLIDLGAEYSINAVVIINRVDCCQARLRNTKIQLSRYSDMRSSLESHLFSTTEGSQAVVTWSPGDSCRDRNTSCAYWAGIGECSKNPNYMLNFCKTSCKVDGCHH